MFTSTSFESKLTIDIQPGKEEAAQRASERLADFGKAEMTQQPARLIVTYKGTTLSWLGYAQRHIYEILSEEGL